MFKILGYNKIIQNDEKYLSFPDIIQSEKNKNKFFLVYRSGESHHPLNSYLHFLVSEDYCETWTEYKSFPLYLHKHGKVWNCPRFSYLPDHSLNIICDTKTSTNEVSAIFEIYMLKSFDDGETFSLKKTGIKGMVPDRIIKFKSKLFCANHIFDKSTFNLAQFVNISKDKGLSWNNKYLIAQTKRQKFCEASLINFKNEYLMAYLRDNKRNKNGTRNRYIYKYISRDGFNWSRNGKIPFYGHRVTAFVENDRLFASFRNTKDITLTVITSQLNKSGNEKNIEFINIDQEYPKRLFDFGYSGMVKCKDNIYIIVYYIRNDEVNPYIKSCFFEYKND
jgi:sucrose-6-phosphate hydrolase SacC (GH32 family)